MMPCLVEFSIFTAKVFKPVMCDEAGKRQVLLGQVSFARDQ